VLNAYARLCQPVLLPAVVLGLIAVLEGQDCQQGCSACRTKCECEYNMALSWWLFLQALASYDASLKVVNTGNDYEWIRVRSCSNNRAGHVMA